MSYTVSASRCKAHYVSLGEFSKRLPKFPDSEETRAQVKPIFAENIQDIPLCLVNAAPYCVQGHACYDCTSDGYPRDYQYFDCYVDSDTGSCDRCAYSTPKVKCRPIPANTSEASIAIMLRITAFLMRVNYDQYYDLGLWKASETGTGFEKTQLLIELREARDNLFSWAKEFAG